MVQGRIAVLILRVHVGASFDQHPYRRNSPVAHGMVQGRIAALVLRVHVGAGFKQHP